MKRLTCITMRINVLARYYINTMKQRPEPLPDSAAEASFKALARALAGMSRSQDVAAFLQDLCTPAEIEAMADRWRVVPLLLDGVPYREIHDRTQVSVTTIGRVARTLDQGAGGYGIAARHALPHAKAAH